LSTWLAHPSPWLPSYPLYIVSGVVAAWHLDDITVWLRRSNRLVAALFAGSIGLALLSYAIDLQVIGMPALRASEVFQPTVVVESMAFIVGQYALGLWVADRIGARGERELTRATDVSFGVYLVPPILIQGLLIVMDHSALGPAWGRLPHSVALLLVFVVLMPLLYVTAAAAVGIARRTPFSLALTVRPAKQASRSRERVRVLVPRESAPAAAMS
jgi:hypothetical protein